MISIAGGRRIDVSDEQEANADSPRIERLLGLSNVTIERDKHKPKQDSEMVRTDEGRQIDLSEQSENANPAKTEMQLPASNARPFRLRHLAKQFDSIRSTCFRSVISLSDPK
jgi:hypothetical protein